MIIFHVGFTILKVVWAVQPNSFPHFKNKSLGN